MAKPEWGQKRTCSGCGLRFYDLIRDPITCPNCGETIDPTAFSRTRRSRTAPAKPVVTTTPIEKETTDPDEAAAVTDSDDNDDNILEDPSDLDEDGDDVSEVVDRVEDSDVDNR